MNNESFLIEEVDLEQAQKSCKYISDSKIRNRAMANVLASNIAKKYFQDIEIDTESGLHNISQVLEVEEISDIYINGVYVDVRVYFNEDEIFVPKSHFDNEIQPVAYMFIKLNDELSDGLVTGFILSENIDTNEIVGNYYKLDENDFISYYDVEPVLIKDTVDLPEDYEKQVFDFLDRKHIEKKSFYKLLLNNEEAREILANAAKAQNIFNFVSIDETIKETTSKVENLPTNDEIIENVEEAFELSNEEESFEILNETSEVMELAEVEDTESIDLLEPVEIENELLEDAENDEISLTLDSTDNIDESLELQEDNSLLEETIENDEIDLPSFEETEAIDLTSADLEETIEVNDEENIYQIEDSISIENSENDNVEIGSNNTEYNFSTTTTPSMEAIEAYHEENSEKTKYNETENAIENIDDNNDELLEELVKTDNIQEENIDDNFEDISETSNIEEDPEVENSDIVDNSEFDAETTNNEETIDTLFETEDTENIEETPNIKPKNNKLTIVALVTLLAAMGYYGITKFILPTPNEIEPQSVENIAADKKLDTNKASAKSSSNIASTTNKKEEAMPVETVENLKNNVQSNEGTALSIPAIEQNLDASINISNLIINWEVPAGYVNSTAAKRYFTKIGKIIQLNLKSELLLLSKQPITNKIVVELDYDSKNNKFGFKKFVTTSGEKVVDDVIKQTIVNVLDMEFNTNISVFKNIQGNPILVIKL